MNSLLDFDNNLLTSNSDSSINFRNYCSRIKKTFLPDLDPDVDPIPIGMFSSKGPSYQDWKNGYAHQIKEPKMRTLNEQLDFLIGKPIINQKKNFAKKRVKKQLHSQIPEEEETDLQKKFHKNSPLQKDCPKKAKSFLVQKYLRFEEPPISPILKPRSPIDKFDFSKKSESDDQLMIINNITTQEQQEFEKKRELKQQKKRQKQNRELSTETLQLNQILSSGGNSSVEKSKQITQQRVLPPKIGSSFCSFKFKQQLIQHNRPKNSFIKREDYHLTQHNFPQNMSLKDKLDFLIQAQRKKTNLLEPCQKNNFLNYKNPPPIIVIQSGQNRKPNLIPPVFKKQKLI